MDFLLLRGTNGKSSDKRPLVCSHLMRSIFHNPREKAGSQPKTVDFLMAQKTMDPVRSQISVSSDRFYALAYTEKSIRPVAMPRVHGNAWERPSSTTEPSEKELSPQPTPKGANLISTNESTRFTLCQVFIIIHLHLCGLNGAIHCPTRPTMPNGNNMCSGDDQYTTAEGSHRVHVLSVDA